ncbi:hypothetical protein CARUB_v10002259mg [Capsella rubella]|uniref:40S ribosomal protein S14 n=1 Tax=Capsella rubella TaxID=81985 RepID=R0H9X9_9BRAS|nr:hypothetical protein CARUB_v10002259mg [Capsella rubella]
MSHQLFVRDSIFLELFHISDEIHREMKVKAERDAPASILAALHVAQRCKEHGITAIRFKLRASGGNKTKKTTSPSVKSVIRNLARSGLKIGRIEDVTPIPTDSTCRKSGTKGKASVKISSYIQQILF